MGMIVGQASAVGWKYRLFDLTGHDVDKNHWMMIVGVSYWRQGYEDIIRSEEESEWNGHVTRFSQESRVPHMWANIRYSKEKVEIEGRLCVCAGKDKDVNKGDWRIWRDHKVWCNLTWMFAQSSW